jgi:cell division protein FtsA
MEAYTDFIAAIDLGTSRLTGMVGRRNASGTLTIIACETEESCGAVRRGCIFNIEETAAKVKKLLQRLERSLNGFKIVKIYVGVGGQSIHSLDYSVKKELGGGGEVTEDLLDILREECLAYRPELLDVLDVVSSSYFVDGNPTVHPAGISCKRIEVCFKLIVGRPSLKKHILNCLVDKARIKVAGITISPLALADAVLTNYEKELGCALIDFGAGVTSLSVYKGGMLQFLYVIPLGGHLITRDLMSLNLVEPEAEKVKIAYGRLMADKEYETTVQVNAADNVGVCEVKLNEVNNVVEARAREILENVFTRLETMEIVRSLGAGIVITGGASCLRNLPDFMQRRLKKEVRFASLRKDILENDSPDYDTPENAVAIGLLMIQGAENCSSRKVSPPPPPPAPPPPPEEPEKENKPPKEKKSKVTKPRKMIDMLIGRLFEEEDMR